MPIVKSVKS